MATIAEQSVDSARRDTEGISVELRPGYRFWRKVVNTFLQVRWLWRLVYPRASSYERALDATPPATLFQKIRFNLKWKLYHTLWFWPRVVDAKSWAHQSHGDRWDPRGYVELWESSHILVDEVAARAVRLDARILDLGCNCGRHLNALAERGFTDLCGVDVGGPALAYMDVAFPGLKRNARITHATFQQYLSAMPDRTLDIVFTHGATVEVVHPSFSLVSELARVSTSYVILLINENGHSYPRFWSYEFARTGFSLVKLLRPCHAGNSNSLLVFHRNEP